MIYDIELPNPFGLGIRIIEIEDKLPSFGTQVDFKLELPRGKFSYSATDMWFECAMFDEFLLQLKKVKAGQASKADFYDMDKELLLCVTGEEVKLSMDRIHIELGCGSLKLENDIEPEVIDQYISHIESFAKWW